MARFGRLDDGEYPFFIKRTRSWQDVACVLPDSLTVNRQKTKADRLTANVPISLSGIIGCRAESRHVFLLFFSLSPAFLVCPPPPTGLSDPCSHRRKNKTRVTLSGHHRDRGTWSTRRSCYLAPIKDTYLLLVSGKRESLFHIPRDHGYHLAEIVPRTSCHVQVAS